MASSVILSAWQETVRSRQARLSMLRKSTGEPGPVNGPDAARLAHHKMNACRTMLPGDLDDPENIFIRACPY